MFKKKIPKFLGNMIQLLIRYITAKVCAAQNQNSFLVKRQKDNTSPAATTENNYCLCNLCICEILDMLFSVAGKEKKKHFTATYKNKDSITDKKCSLSGTFNTETIFAQNMIIVPIYNLFMSSVPRS